MQEACDDGNTDDGDGCSSLCEVEVGWEKVIQTDPDSGFNFTTAQPVCGDGMTIGA